MNTTTIQNALKAASPFIPGADPGAIDGIRGARTEAAARNTINALCDWLENKQAAFKRPVRAVKRVFIHCSASDHAHHDDISVMRDWHIKRGWNDVGYHYFIQQDGTVQTGRPLEKAPSAQKGHNSGTIAICVHGHHSFTDAQYDALRALCGDINAAIPGVTFHGHCEVSAKSCPVFDYKQVLGLDAKGVINRVA